MYEKSILGEGVYVFFAQVLLFSAVFLDKFCYFPQYFAGNNAETCFPREKNVKIDSIVAILDRRPLKIVHR
jgi:hypothetical protein